MADQVGSGKIWDGESLTATTNSDAIDLAGGTELSISASAPSTAGSGTFKLQGSNDKTTWHDLYLEDLANGGVKGNWAVTASQAFSEGFDFETRWKYIRCVYTVTVATARVFTVVVTVAPARKG